MDADGPQTLTPRLHEDGRSRLVAYDHGAHLASWEVDGEPVIWLGEHAVLDGSTSIRGGVPICFPWFADGPEGEHSPSHGLVRTTTWRPVEALAPEVWAWELADTDVDQLPGAGLLPGTFRARYAVRLTTPEEPDRSPTLGLELAVHNPGTSAYRFEAALHTYLAVRDVEQVRVLGLAGADYLDKTTWTREQQQGEVRIEGETDRVYDSVGRPRLVLDDRGRAHVVLDPEGAAQTVVWNPGAVKAAGLDDLGEQEWRRFVCVETAATAAHALEVEPGQTVRIGCTYQVLPYPSP